MELETSNLVGRLAVASASPAMVNHPVRGVVRSRKPLKFQWAPTMSLERLSVSGAVNLVSRSVSVINFWWSSDNCWSHMLRDLYSAARPSKRTSLITMWCYTEYLAYTEPQRRAGLSAAVETLVLRYCHRKAPYMLRQSCSLSGSRIASKWIYPTKRTSISVRCTGWAKTGTFLWPYRRNRSR